MFNLSLSAGVTMIYASRMDKFDIQYTSSWKILASSSPIVRFKESSLSTLLVSSLSDSATVNCKCSCSFSAVSSVVSLTSLLSAAGFCSSTSSSFSSGSSSAFFEVSSSSSPPFAYRKKPKSNNEKFHFIIKIDIYGLSSLLSL